MSISGASSKQTKTKIKSRTKTKKLNKQLILKEKMMDSDDEDHDISTISPKMYDFISKPEGSKACGDVFITIILRLEEIYDKDRNDLCKELVGYNFEDYQKFLKSQKRAANKRAKAKEERFIPTDEKGLKLKKTNLRNEFMKVICKLRTKKDEKNREYFKDAKFNNMAYINVEWKKFKEQGKDYTKLDAKGNKIKGLHKKITNQLNEINSIFDKAFEKQKPPKKPNTRWSGYFIFADEFRKKNQDKPKYKEHRGIKFMSIVGDKWNKLSEEQKNVYNTRAKVLNKENQKKLVIWEKEMETRKMELIKKTESKLGKDKEGEVTDSSISHSGTDDAGEDSADNSVDNSADNSASNDDEGDNSQSVSNTENTDTNTVYDANTDVESAHESGNDSGDDSDDGSGDDSNDGSGDDSEDEHKSGYGDSDTDSD